MQYKIVSAQNLGKVLRSTRKQKKLTQTSVGKAVGITQATISEIEGGKPGTELNTLFRVLASLDLELIVQPKTHQDNDLKGDNW
jgi:HTH-type transcriptional regulator/antitoxin HipB